MDVISRQMNRLFISDRRTMLSDDTRDSRHDNAPPESLVPSTWPRSI